MQIDIESIATRFHRDDLADGEFAIQHHGACLHIGQRFRGKAQRGGRDFTEAIFLRFFQVGIQRIATLHFPFFAGDDADPAIDPFAGAGAKHLHAIQPNFHIKAAVDDKFAIAAYQIAILRRNGDLESDTLCG